MAYAYVTVRGPVLLAALRDLWEDLEDERRVRGRLPPLRKLEAALRAFIACYDAGNDKVKVLTSFLVISRD